MERMKRYRQTGSVLIILSALAFLGMFGASSHAGKTTTVFITISGAIEGSGTDANAMALTFFGLNSEVAGSYVANPDRGLSVSGPGRTGLTLSYYFCNHESHLGSIAPCSDPAHDPRNYERLLIRGGVVVGKRQSTQVVFPAGCTWEIWRKARDGDPLQGVQVASSQLTEPVMYRETVLN